MADRQERLYGKLLEHDPHAFSQFAAGRRIRRVKTEHGNATMVSLAKALEDLDDRGLACPVRPEQCEDLALVHLKGNVPHCFGHLVGLSELLDGDNRHATSFNVSLLVLTLGRQKLGTARNVPIATHGDKGKEPYRVAEHSTG